MIERIRSTWQILVLFSLVLVLGILLLPSLHVGISLSEFIVTVISVAIVNVVTYLVMSAGIQKNSSDGVAFLLGGIGLKFILYLLFILLFWIVTKNLSKPFILTFFALYLIFTFFTAFRLFKLLKNK